MNKASFGKRTGHFVLLFVTLNFCFFIFEIGIRVFNPQNLIKGKPIHTYDPQLEKRLLPNEQVEYRTPEYVYQVATNSAGFRDRSHSRNKPEDVTRILILGDSFTFGPGVAQEYIFPRLMEKLLNQATQNKNSYELITMACGGWGPEHYLAALQHEGLAYSPDLIVLAIYVDNDVTDRLELAPPAKQKPKWHFKSVLYAINNWLEVRSHVFIFLRTRLDYPLWKLGLRPYFFPPVFWRDIPQNIQEDWDRTFQVLEKIAQVCALSGAKPVCVLIPARYQVHEAIWNKFVDVYDIDLEKVDLQLPQKLFVDFFQKQKIAFLDLLPPFRTAGKNELLYFPMDGHWNAAGHALSAELITQFIQQKKDPMLF
ncbi:MAG: SGNH/GDSL hydrolase family protein [bacterium]